MSRGLQDYENTRVLWNQHMGYPCETCCRKDAELLEIAQSERELLHAAVAELKAAPQPAVAPAPARRHLDRWRARKRIRRPAVARQICCA